MSHRATVLVVDDDLDTVETMRDILRDEGHSVVCASNGRDALERAAEVRPDLVILDLEMPEMDGWSFLDALRADPELASTPVVVLSGTTADLRNVGAEAVRKPLRLHTLLAIIRRVAFAAR